MPNTHTDTPEVHYSLKQEMSELYWAIAIKNFAVYLIGIFLIVYVYQLFGESIEKTFLFYAAQFTLMLLVLPFAAKSLSTLGLKKSMAIGNPFLAVYIISLLLASTYGLWLIGVAIVAKVAYFTLFWPARHVEFARFAKKKKEGRQVGIANIITVVVKALGPLVGGFIIVRYGFTPVLILSSCLIAISSFPLFFSPEVYEKYSLSWKESFTSMFKKKNRAAATAFYLHGFESGVRLFVFPLFVYLILTDFQTIGFLTSGTMVIGIVFTYFLGWLADHKGGRRVLGITSVFQSFSLLLSIFITSPFSYFMISAYMRLSEVAVDLPMMQYVYRKARLRHKGIDEYIVMRELALGAGRVTMFALIIAGFSLGITSFFPFFVLAAMASIGLRVLK